MSTFFRTLLILLFLSVSTGITLAQKTKSYTDNLTHFEQGKNLYIKKLYVPAIQEFQEFLKQNTGPNFDYEARAYICLSRLKLDKKKASKDVAQLLRNEPEHKLNTEITYELGLYYFGEKKYSWALKYLEQIKSTDITKEQRDELVFKLGYSYFKNKNYAEAKAQFKQVMNGDGKYAIEASYYYGYQCYILKDYACAISTFEKIGDKGPRTMQLYLSQIYYEQEDYNRAFDKVKDINLPKQQDEIELLTGKIQYQLGNKSVALFHFDKYTGDIKKLSSDEIFQFASANYEAERYDKSTDYYIYIANEDNEIGQSANYFLGVADVKNDQKQRALNAFGEAKRKDYNKEIGEIASFNYAKLAAELQKNGTAISAIKEFLEVYTASEYRDEAKSMMADIFLSTKNYKAAIEVLEEIGNLNSNTKTAYQELTFHRGEELFLNKEYQNADIFFKKSLKYPKDKTLEALAYFWMSEIAFKVDDYVESINMMNRFMSNSGADRSKNKTYGYYSMGYNYFKQEQYPKAQNYFVKFNQFETYTSTNKEIYLDNTQRLADCYFLNGQYNPAIAEYGFIIKNDYKNADYAIFQQGMLYGLQERYVEKINVLKKIQNDFKKSIYEDDALYQIGKEYMTLKNYSTAESMFNLLISQHDYSPFLPDSYLKLGLINYTQHKDDVALGYYKTVVERFPKTNASNEALTFIEIIYNNQGDPQGYFDYVEKIPGAGIRLTKQDSTLYQLAINIYENKDFVGASEELGNYINRFGENGFFIIPANYYKAEADYYTDKENQALAHYEYVVNQGSNNYTEKSLVKLSGTYSYRKNYSKAIRFYQQLEPISASKSTYISSIMGQMRCHYILKNYSAAKAKAIQLLPIENVPTEDLVEANMLLGRLQLKDNNLRTARFHFDYVIANSRNEQTAEALYQRGYIEYDQGDLDSARSDVYKLQDNFSAYEFWVVKGFILLSDIYVKEKDYFQAKATLQSILDNYNKEGNGLLDLCRMKLKQLEKMENTDDVAPLEEE